MYRLLGHLYDAQADGRTVDTEELMELEQGVPSSRLQDLLRTLMDQNLITQDQDGAWILKRDLNRYTLRDLYREGDFHLPIGKEMTVPSDSPWDRPFLSLVNADALRLDTPLAELYRAADGPDHNEDIE